MKLLVKSRWSGQAGMALALTIIMSAIALAVLASVMAWSSSSSRLTHRSIQYSQSVAAAEAVTESVVGQVTQDFLAGGEAAVNNNLNTYRQIPLPATADTTYWNGWQFDDGNGNLGQAYVQYSDTSNYVVLDSTYAGLKGYVSTFTVASHATDTTKMQPVTGGVLEQLQLTRIPIFQFAMYSSGNMEISCGEPFDITGRVHSNQQLFVEPDSTLTFESAVTAVVDILFQRDPLDPRGLTPGGSVVYVNPDEKNAPVAALTLPIGVTNTPEAIRSIIEVPPSGEDPDSAQGRLRYNNNCDLRVVVSDTGITGSSGDFNEFGTTISSNALASFVSVATNGGFQDNREGKTVLPINIDIGALTQWSETNTTLSLALLEADADPQGILSSIYIVDNRTLPANELNAVRLFDGATLPPNGLTVATAQPLYVQGDYNSDVAERGTSNTTNTFPASLAADAITILSDAWRDGTTGPSINPPTAQNTTVNAAILTGSVPTTTAAYSGGMENFPRFLENWGNATFTYNGSMVNMFPSLYATGIWGQNNVYDPPTRNWAYDINFDNPNKLPPKTPSLLTVARTVWSTIPPGQNTPAPAL